MEWERTMKLAGDPDRGCTFTPHSSGFNLYVSRARACSREHSSYQHPHTRIAFAPKYWQTAHH